MSVSATTTLSNRMVQALDYALQVHATQVRKGTDIPYLSHLLAVCALVLEYGGDEDQAIAALLHDVIEDGGAQHEDEIRLRFGDDVTDIVVGCTDASLEYKASDDSLAAWTARKQAYIAHLRGAGERMLLVSACDKLHNTRSINYDLRAGANVFDRFTGRRDGTPWYYREVAEALAARNVAPATELRRAVEEMIALAEE